MSLEELHRRIKENEAWIHAVEKSQRKMLWEVDRQRQYLKTIKNYVAEQDGFMIDYAPQIKKFVWQKKKRYDDYSNPM